MLIDLRIWWFQVRLWVGKHLFTAREKALMSDYFRRKDAR